MTTRHGARPRPRRRYHELYPANVSVNGNTQG
jgi:hypothetical protein